MSKPIDEIYIKIESFYKNYAKKSVKENTQVIKSYTDKEKVVVFIFQTSVYKQ